MSFFGETLDLVNPKMNVTDYLQFIQILLKFVDAFIEIFIWLYEDPPQAAPP